eukprot:TRINITY_DN9223_c0_g2_i3.p1 TRINITY_DN9223_c0_g2~~TRINITY_DN9223_c0_g2_i3.p1  ORF type:complete len:150 (-),score=15.64 TRINITY_DN9223_c0_g2_i3:51-500(-)
MLSLNNMASASSKTGGKTKGNCDGGACDISDGGAPKKAKREQKFLASYSKDYPCIVASKIDSTYAKCTACESDFRVSHGGITDVIKHVKTLRHVTKAAALKNTAPLGHFIARGDVLVKSLFLSIKVKVHTENLLSQEYSKLLENTPKNC